MKEQLHIIIPWVINVVRYFLLAGIPFLIFYILFPDFFKRNKIQRKIAKNKDFIREIMHSMQTTFIIAGIGLLILKTPLREYTQVYYDLAAFPLLWIPLSIVIALIIHDTYFYWMHRSVHHPKIYKRVHLLHHKSVNPSPWASYSFHFYEGVLEALIAPIILVLVPMHPLSLFLFTILAFAINVYGHLGYEIAPRWFRKSILFELLNTSIYHNMHHSKFKGNYGLYFRFWDRIMGTEHPDYVKEYDEVQARRFGGRPLAPSYGWMKAFFLVIALLGIGLVSAKAQSTIKGKWKQEENGGTILIYEEDGFYYGQLIAADSPEENAKIQAHEKKIFILKDFKKENETQFCCGTVYAPRKKKTLSGSMILEDENTLKVSAQYKMFSGSKTFTRL